MVLRLVPTCCAHSVFPFPGRTPSPPERPVRLFRRILFKWPLPYNTL